MELFLSWSGPRSKAVASVLREEIPKIVHSVKPWVSDTHIPGGVGWFQSIEQAAAACSSAIIVVTPENQDAPWLNFEAGAFALLSGSTAVPLLVGFEGRTLESGSPLSQINNERLDNEERMRRLLTHLAPDEHQQRQAASAFDDRWASVLDRCGEALKTPLDAEESVPAPPSPDQVGVELIARMQSMERLLERMASGFDPESPTSPTRTQVRRVLDAMQQVEYAASPSLPPSWYQRHAELRDAVKLIERGTATSSETEAAYNLALQLVHLAEMDRRISTVFEDE